MNLRNYASIGALLLLCVTFCASALAVPVNGQSQISVDRADGTFSVPLESVVYPAQYNGDVRDLAADEAPSYFHIWSSSYAPPHRKVSAAEFNNPEPESNVSPLAAMPAPAANFAGLSFDTAVTGGTAGAGWPSNANGDVGPVYYIQGVNNAWGIFNKATGALTASFTENQLWSGAGTGTPCDANNQGDPVVLHDGLTDRWILTNYAFAVSGGNPAAPFYQCIAVSKTNDPVAGGYYLYAVRIDTGAAGAPPAGTLGDYPKFGLWTDCLYMGANGSHVNPRFNVGAIFAAFDRTALYAGTTLTTSNSSLGFIAADANGDPFGLFPANLLGTSLANQPPQGRPEYFVSQSNDISVFEVRTFQQGATSCGAGSTLSAETDVTQTAYGFPASPDGSTTNIVAQKGTTNKLDALSDELMQKVQYRKVIAAESLWVVHNTCGPTQSAIGTCTATTTTTQPQWAQIDVTGGTINTTPVQQQFYAPDATVYRWMGSLAIDIQGNMALGYSTSNATSFPGIAYSGRLVTDAANTLPQTETSLVAGAGSEVNCNATPCSTWGSYSSMSIDPVDDCTFWYTNQYFATAGAATNGHWDTRIGSFKFPNCGVIGVATKVAFDVNPNASYVSNNPITVRVTIEDAAGNVVTSNTSAVTISLQGGTAGATLGGTKTVNAVGGIATFTNLSVDKVGTAYQFKAVDGALTAGTSTSFNITVGPAAKIAVTTQPPASSQSGVGFGAVVTVQDSGGNTVTTSSASVTLAMSGGTAGATLGSTTTVNAVNGLATFSGLSVDKVGTAYLLTATSTGLTSATSNTFNITPGVASKLLFTTQPPATSQSAAAFGGAVTIQDAAGNTVTSSTASVTLTLSGGTAGATLSGTKTINAVAGVATFSGLSVDKSGTNYVLNAASTGLTGSASNTFNITPGAATKIIFTTQPPASSQAGAAFGATVTVQDAAGNTVTSSTAAVALTLSGGTAGATLSGTKTVNAVAGIATFTGLSVDKIGTNYVLNATSAGLTNTASSTFNITAGAASKVVFTTQPPGSSQSGAAFGAVATVQDAGGNTVTTSSASVTLSLSGGTAGATLSGTKTVNAVNGIATFTGLSVDKVGTAYVLNASSTGLTSAASNTFNITVGAASKVVFTTQPPASSQSGGAFGAVATVQDSGGNTVTTSTASVVLTLSGGTAGATLSGTKTVNAVAGVATFNGLSVDKIGTAYVLNAASTGLTGAPSSKFDITSGAAAKIIFTAQPPASSSAGAGFGATVTVEDSAGNTVTSSSASIKLTLSGGTAGATLGGTATVSATNGVATFSGLTVDKVGTNYVLNATSAGLTGTASSTFNITVGAAAKVTFTTQPPASSLSGATFGAVVTVQDAGGNKVATSSATVTLALSGGTAGAILGGTTTVNAVNGVATFTGLSVDKSGTAYVLNATSTGLSGGASNTFNITPGAAAKLIFTTQPAASSQLGVPFASVVTVQDAAGNTVTSNNSTVNLTLINNITGATLTGGSTAAVSGVATFNLSVNKLGTGYQLSAADGALTGATSSAFNITPGPPAVITFTTQPSNATAGVSISPAIVVHVVDAGNDPLSGISTMLTISNNPGSALLNGGSPVSTDSNGNATFSGVSLDKFGVGYTLAASAGSAPNAISSGFDIHAAAAATITFTTQPSSFSNLTAGANIPVIATVEDAFGNAVSGNTVTLSLGANAGGSTLSVTTNPVVTDSNGNATFDGVSLDKVGTGYTLKAGNGTVPTTTSNSFNIVAGAASQLVFTKQPKNVKRGNTLNAVEVTEEDAMGNVVPDSSSTVDFTIPTTVCGNALDLGTFTLNNGVAILSDTQHFYSAAAGLTISASSGSLNATSSSFNVVPNADLIFSNGFDGCRP